MKYKRLSTYKKKKIAQYKAEGKRYMWVLRKLKLKKGTLTYHWNPTVREAHKLRSKARTYDHMTRSFTSKVLSNAKLITKRG